MHGGIATVPRVRLLANTSVGTRQFVASFRNDGVSLKWLLQSVSTFSVLLCSMASVKAANADGALPKLLLSSLERQGPPSERGAQA